MRFVFRGLAGLWLFLLTAGLAVLAALHLAGTLRDDAPPRRVTAQERVYVVATDVLEPLTARPVIETHGTVRSWRTLELRAPVSGRIIEVADRFRDGASVAAGNLLVRIDPTDYEAQVAEAEAGLAEARAGVAEARQAVTATEIERRSAETQRSLRAASLERQKDLAARGVAAGAAVEEAELALAAAEQRVASRGQAVVTAELRVARAELAVHRAELSLAKARRDLADTVIRAPFDGVVAEAAVGPGDLAAPNEVLGSLIDPDALEVSFHVTTAEFIRLLGDDGALRPLPVTVGLSLGDDGLATTGVLDRPDAAVETGRTGRTLFARLDADRGLWLKPGDFVTVRLGEPPLAHVAVVPARAVDAEGGILLLGDDGRLESHPATVLRREADRIMLTNVPFGAIYVTDRGPHLARGLLARPREVPPSSPDSIALDPDRRALLMAFVRGDATLPADRRARLLDALARPETPRRVVESLEARMTGG